MAKESRKIPFVPKKRPIKVPPGYRFKPTDEELVVHYLKKRAYDQPLQPNIIEEVELYQYSPDALTEDPNNERRGVSEWYFFTPRQRKYRNGGRPDRAAGDGYWKATGADKPVKIRGKTVIGLKKTLVYYKGKPPRGEKTEWIMHEFVLTDAPPRERAGIDDMRLDDWVLCKVYRKTGTDRRQHGTPKTETEEEQQAAAQTAVGAIAIKDEQEQQHGNINIQVHQVGDQVGGVYNNMLPNLYNGASTSGEITSFYNGYGGAMVAPLYIGGAMAAPLYDGGAMAAPLYYGGAMAAPLYNGASTSGETAPLYHVSTSGNSGFPESLDAMLKHYNTMFPRQAKSGYDSFIPTAAPVSSTAPTKYDPMGQYYPSNMIHDQHTAGNEGLSSHSNLNSSFPSIQQPLPSLPSNLNSSFPPVQEPFPSLPSNIDEFSDEDAYLLDMDLDFGINNNKPEDGM